MRAGKEDVRGHNSDCATVTGSLARLPSALRLYYAIAAFPSWLRNSSAEDRGWLVRLDWVPFQYD